MANAYQVKSRALLFGDPKRQYILTIRDLPSDDRPREKLLNLGPGQLSPQELLAVVLSSGTRKEGVLEMSQRITTEYGDRHLFSAMQPQQLADELEIPLGKALQIVAVGELGRRFFAKQKNGKAVLRSAEDVFHYTADMRNLSKEHLRGIYINQHYQVVHDEVVSIGTLDTNITHPREVFRPAIACGAAGVILVHNHPSGIAEPSEQDRLVTKQIAEAGKLIGIELVDHVIITEQNFVSSL